MRGKNLLVLALLVFSITAAASNLPLPPPEVTSSITARDLKRHLSFLASDELGGRYTLSPQNRIAARYLVSQLESYGYRGAARDGSFFQKVPLSYRKIDAVASKVVLSVQGMRQEFNCGQDFAAEAADADVSGELVFAGYGISLPQHDDYAKLDVKGKVVVVAPGMPRSLASLRFSEQEHKGKAAWEHGAIAVIAIAPPQLLLAWNHISSTMFREVVSLPPQSAVDDKYFPFVYAGPSLIKAIASAMGKSISYFSQDVFEPATIAARIELKIKAEVKPAPLAQNVVGVLEGSDPKLKDEYVLFSAHYDHLQTGPNGEVYKGADDDGSGTVSVLEIAQAFAIGPRPRRSILIIFHTGEELGLLGSRFNTDYEPVVPLSKIVADFNIDMIGRSRPEDDLDQRDAKLSDKNSLYIIGSDKLSTELHNISEQTNAETARLRLDYTYNDPAHPERLYYRSDHYNYAKHGIPIIFYFTGLHRDYHKPTDDVEKIDFEKMERIVRMIFATGWRVANMDHRPVVDKAAHVSGSGGTSDFQ
jgi:hypothetical protein